MKKPVKLIVMTFAISMLIVMVLGLRSVGSSVSIGEPGYDFEMQDLEGDLHRLSDYEGEMVFMNFFATWCYVCVEEAPELEAFNEEFKDQMNLFVVVRGEPVRTVQRYVDETKSNKTYLFDFNTEIGRKFGVTGQPETLVINEEGIIIDHFVGAVSRDFLAGKLEEYKGNTIGKYTVD
ncbi:hypothetical protein BKP35_04485 [Anaerobacillus arseniciselenatis]|uniref:Thioredoxin domain-containing protein n=1 Tax=Anaerobacillus arseniciselenatis TaxID=85682 RepID=A0A1S2LXW0_9BACI|nr:TlpA disulfide reductase family protein [Anaerobacillus arseniciselenatis]OIJ16235.1 hypothetical protein BKP35_04485 [Anaerobacillus arseniciselenatis]